MLKMVAFFPHPPIAVPEVGKKEAAKVRITTKAMGKLAEELAEINPQLIVAITPHGHVFSDAVTITGLKDLQGDLSSFGAPQVKVEFRPDEDAVQAILQESQDNHIPCASLDENMLKKFKLENKLDHGLVVPLSFLYKTGWRGKLVPINMAFLSYEELYRFGRTLSLALDKLNVSWVLLVSGDLSHRLKREAPAGYSPRGAVFDEIVRQSIREGDVKRLINIDSELVEEAGECGLRPLIIALGSLDGYQIEAKELSYEGPFGIGYMVAWLKRGQKMPERELADVLYEDRKKRMKEITEKESLLVKIARESISYYLTKGKFMRTPEIQERDLLDKKAGVFVSLKKYGHLRGCIGTIEPTKDSLIEEVIRNAVSAAVSDPRFEPVLIEEMDDIIISVDVLEKPEKVSLLKELNPQIYGVIVSCGRKRGLLLPDLPGIDTPEEQVKIAGQKAGIGSDEKVVLERFKVTRYT